MKPIRFDGVEVGVYHLAPMPGCPAVGILHGSVIYPQFRNKGYGKESHVEKYMEAQRLGFEVLFCTTKADNTPEIRILEHWKWKRLRTFDNPKTGNTVVLWMKHLTDPYEEFGGV